MTMDCLKWTSVTLRRPSSLALVSCLGALGMTFAADEAAALSARVKLACASDYMAHCRNHAVGTPGLRQCMRDAGPNLSKRCLNALRAEGEVSDEEIARRAAQLR